MTNFSNFARSRKRNSLKKGTGGINPCYRPSNEASKSDLAEFHREDLALRRSHQLARTATNRPFLKTKSDDAAYRKSIWPAAKVARRQS